MQMIDHLQLSWDPREGAGRGMWACVWPNLGTTEDTGGWREARCSQLRGGLSVLFSEERHPDYQGGCGNLEDLAKGCFPWQRGEWSHSLGGVWLTLGLLKPLCKGLGGDEVTSGAAASRPGSVALEPAREPPSALRLCQLTQLSRHYSCCSSHRPVEKTKPWKCLVYDDATGNWWRATNPGRPASGSHLTFLLIKKVLDELLAPGEQGGFGSLGSGWTLFRFARQLQDPVGKEVAAAGWGGHLCMLAFWKTITPFNKARLTCTLWASEDASSASSNCAALGGAAQVGIRCVICRVQKHHCEVH